MKAGSITNPGSRLAQVTELSKLRADAKDDPKAAKKLVSLCRVGMLEPRWERRASNVVSLPRKPHGSGTRLAQLERQIARATSPEERRQFELTRDVIEREEEKTAKKKIRVAA